MTDQTPEFSIANLLIAIEATSTELSAKGDRITALEANNYRLQEENDKLRAQLGELIRHVKATKSDIDNATQSADRAEADAAVNLSRANQLQADLVATNNEMAHIASAVSSLLVHHEFAPMTDH